eukprot:c22296_g1_i1 orf=1209-1865(-)
MVGRNYKQKGPRARSYHELNSLVCFLFILCPTAVISLTGLNNSPNVSKLNNRIQFGQNRDVTAVMRISIARRHLQLLNKSAVKSIQSLDGDIIDCVLREAQPAMDHPLLKHQKIQDPPTDLIPRKLEAARRFSSNTVMQLWRRNGNCPVGTVPIRRTSMEDLLRVWSPTSYGRKTNRPARMPRVGPTDVVESGNHEVSCIEPHRLKFLVFCSISCLSV